MNYPSRIKPSESLEADRKTARDLPLETKKLFHRMLFKEGKNLGAARGAAGISIMVAAQLVVSLPTKQEDIT